MNKLETKQIPTAYMENAALSSVVSYPQRCSLWGDSKFHGNCDGTLFKELVHRYRPKSVADPMMGSGTTRDVIDGLNRYRSLNIRYWGSDLADGFDLSSQPLPGQFDFVWIHPPYWNIVKYSDNAADLCNCTSFDEFEARLSNCIATCIRSLNPNGRLAILVADVRRAGVYFPIVRTVLRLHGLLGEVTSIIIKTQHNCRSDSKLYGTMPDVPIKHEYCIVFRKLATVATAKGPDEKTSGQKDEHRDMDFQDEKTMEFSLTPNAPSFLQAMTFAALRK